MNKDAAAATASEATPVPPPLEMGVTPSSLKASRVYRYAYLTGSCVCGMHVQCACSQYLFVVCICSMYGGVRWKTTIDGNWAVHALSEICRFLYFPFSDVFLSGPYRRTKATFE